MNKFKVSYRGYDKEEVQNFVDETIEQLENLIQSLHEKDAEIRSLNETIEFYKAMEQTLSRAIITVQDTNEQVRYLAREDAKLIINDAKEDAKNIVLEAIKKAQIIEKEVLNLNNSMIKYKGDMRDTINYQLDVLNEVEIFKYTKEYEEI